jgi:hypothetical protein
LQPRLGRWRNVRYACAIPCFADWLRARRTTVRGVLDDDIPAERQPSIDAGLAWRDAAEATVVYTDRGISVGMKFGVPGRWSIGTCLRTHVKVKFRHDRFDPRTHPHRRPRSNLLSGLPDPQDWRTSPAYESGLKIEGPPLHTRKCNG